MIMHNLYSIVKDAEDQRWDLAKLKKLWTMDNLHKGCHPPLNLYSEFCVYQHFLDESFYGRNEKLLGPQIMQMRDTVRYRAIGTGEECGQLDTIYPIVRKSCYSASANYYHRAMLA